MLYLFVLMNIVKPVYVSQEQLQPKAFHQEILQIMKVYENYSPNCVFGNVCVYIKGSNTLPTAEA